MNTQTDIGIATNIIAYIKNSISNGLIDELEKSFNLFDFDLLEYNDSIQLIVSILRWAARGGLRALDPSIQKQVLNVIYDQSDKFFPDNTGIKFITVLFLQSMMDVETLGYLTGSSSVSANFSQVLLELMRVNSDTDGPSGFNGNQVIVAFDKCWKVYTQTKSSTPSLDTLKKLFSLAKNVNTDVAEMLLQKIRVMNDYAPIPKWMIGASGALPRESEVIIPEDYPAEIEFPSDQEITTYLLENLKRNGLSGRFCNLDVSEDELSEMLISIFYAMGLAQRYELIKGMNVAKNLDAMVNDAKLFITLGPSAPLVDVYADDTVTSTDTRMFVFDNFEYNSDIDDFEIDPKIITDWFVGYCQNCNLRIRRRWHAVRVPGKLGGWVGCMCSWKCVRENVVAADDADPIILNLCGIYEAELGAYGILDRIPDDEYEMYLDELEGRDIAQLPVGIYSEDVSVNSPSATTEQIILSDRITSRQKTSADDVMDVLGSPEIITVNKEITLRYYYSSEDIPSVEFIKQIEELRGAANIILVDVESESFDNDVNFDLIVEIPTTVVYSQNTIVAVLQGNNIVTIRNVIAM